MEYEVIVVGAGVAGSSTACHIASALECGSKILLLEQFPTFHTRGNSHGKSRITRRAYDEPFYVHMMDECFRLWDQLEKDSGSKIYTQTGILVFGEDHLMEDTVSSMESNKIAFDKFSGEEANRRWPDQLKLPSSYTCVLEKDGGILAPEEALKAYQNVFVKRGGVLLADCPVTDIIPGDTVQVVTSKGIMFGKKVVITVGPWAQKWADKLDLPHIKFKSMRAEVYYWRAHNPEVFEASNFPVFLHQKENKHYMYGLPIFEYPGLIKIANSLGPVIASPEARDEDSTTKYRDEVAQFIERHFKGVSTEVDTYEPCIVTYTQTADPVLDHHPDYSNIIFGLGFSGHGFKLSPVIGKILCELALGRKLSYDLIPFKINKENNRTKLKHC